MKRFIAFDIGASNGRGMLGSFDGERLSLKEISRFPNEPIDICGSLYWDVLCIFSNIKQTLFAYRKEHGKILESLGIDTWGVDYGLVDKTGKILSNPYCYRDKRNFGLDEEIKKIIDGYEIYKTTGAQIAPISTICQLYSDVKTTPVLLNLADKFLMMPSLLNYFLTGEKINEHSLIIPTCLFDVIKNKPAKDFFRKLNIPISITPDIAFPGTKIGKILPPITEEMGIYTNVTVPATHDTASAVVSVPAENQEEIFFISCGTWSVVGTETKNPVLTEQSYHQGITNAPTAEGKFMTILNIPGLWLLQECKRVWDRDKKSDWEDIIKLAEKAKPNLAFIDVDDPRFTKPDNMVKEIQDYCRQTGQKNIETIGEITRTILESLALKYKDAISKIESVTGKKAKVIHLIGGGSQNRLLCQLTANTVGVPILAGPFEATALGNIIMQMKAAKLIKNVSEGREIVRRSVKLQTYRRK